MAIRARVGLIRIDMQLWRNRECRYRHLAIYPVACVLVGGGHRGRGHERGVELCRKLDLYLARVVYSQLPDVSE